MGQLCGCQAGTWARQGCGWKVRSRHALLFGIARSSRADVTCCHAVTAAGFTTCELPCTHGELAREDAEQLLLMRDLLHPPIHTLGANLAGLGPRTHGAAHGAAHSAAGLTAAGSACRSDHHRFHGGVRPGGPSRQRHHDHPEKCHVQGNEPHGSPGPGQPSYGRLLHSGLERRRRAHGGAE